MRKILLLLCILSITFSAKSQLSAKWNKGSYYDNAGNQHVGWIQWVVPQPSILTKSGDKIYFKAEENGDKVKVTSDSLKSFLVETDSATYKYYVSKNKLLEDKPVLKLLFDNTPKLYVSLTAKQAGGGMGAVGVGFTYVKSEYYFGDDPDNVVKLTKKNFTEVMSKIMAEKPELVERIKDKRLRIGDMDAVLYFYKYGLMPPAAAPDPFSGLDH